MPTRPRNLVAAALSLLVFSAEEQVRAQELSDEELKRILSWTPEGFFVEAMQARFGDHPELGRLDLQHLSSIVAIPAVDAGGASIEDLAKGRLVGALYLSTGSSRLMLDPGVYTVEVSFDDAQQQWRVNFQSTDGKVVGGALASVKEAPTIEVPVTAVDHSVCYRADSWEVCY